MLYEHRSSPAIVDMPLNHAPQFNNGDVVCEGKTRSFDHGSFSPIKVHVVRAKTTSFDVEPVLLAIAKILHFATLLTLMSVFGPVIGPCALVRALYPG